ncbi:MAG TPA: DUF3592 domain-containing protein [Chitinophagaceae bacterium]
MIILYIIIILIGVYPLWKTIRYVQLEEKIRKDGISTLGIVTHIHTTRYHKGPTTDRVHTRYNSNITGHYHEANFVTAHKKYRVGQSITVKYLPEHPDKIIVAPKRGYWPMLIFTTALFLFIIFAVYKIDEMV